MSTKTSFILPSSMYNTRPRIYGNYDQIDLQPDLRNQLWSCFWGVRGNQLSPRKPTRRTCKTRINLELHEATRLLTDPLKFIFLSDTSCSFIRTKHEDKSKCHHPLQTLKSVLERELLTEIHNRQPT